MFTRRPKDQPWVLENKRAMIEKALPTAVLVVVTDSGGGMHLNYVGAITPERAAFMLRSLADSVEGTQSQIQYDEGTQIHEGWA